MMHMSYSRPYKIISILIVMLMITITFTPIIAEARFKRSWARTFGGEKHDIAHEVLLTEDGGYLMVGYSSSYGYRNQVLLYKTNSNGFAEWFRVIGGEYSDRAYAATNTMDGGYAIAGSTTSYGGRDNEDFYLVKTDSEGIVEWEANFGGDHDEIAYDVIQTSDGGYLLGGSTVTFGHRGTDYWVVKTDEHGEKEWSRYFGGQQDEVCTSVLETEDGNFLIGGYTASYGDPGDGLWIIKIDPEGEPIWETNVGGYLDDRIHDMIITNDGGIAAAGDTRSFTELGSNFWLIKLNSEGIEEWNQSYGGDYYDIAYSLLQTPEGNFILAGSETSVGGVQEDIYIVETDGNGNELHSYRVSGGREDIAYSIIQVDDGEYIIAGKTQSYGEGGYSFYLVKIGRPIELTIPIILAILGISIVAIYIIKLAFNKYRSYNRFS